VCIVVRAFFLSFVPPLLFLVAILASSFSLSSLRFGRYHQESKPMLCVANENDETMRRKENEQNDEGENEGNATKMRERRECDAYVMRGGYRKRRGRRESLLEAVPAVEGGSRVDPSLHPLTVLSCRVQRSPPLWQRRVLVDLSVLPSVPDRQREVNLRRRRSRSRLRAVEALPTSSLPRSDSSGGTQRRATTASRHGRRRHRGAVEAGGG
jgi:hypothetical protein